MNIIRVILSIILAAALLASLSPALCWSNGGYSADTSHPDYGTHDWIAQHALDLLPAGEKQYITDNLAAYLYGTELPDRPSTQGGIGDTTKHHVYYSAVGVLVDNASAQRAQTEYGKALAFLKANDFVNASRTAGTMTHYIADLAVFGHVMGASTPWGTETHHSDYETRVNGKTGTYSSTFNSYLSYDGSLTGISAYNATVDLAYNTVFGVNSQSSCVWMDDNYNWSSSTFSGRCGESLNLAVNAVADVLHTLYVDSSLAPTPTSTANPTVKPTPTASLTATPTPTISPTPTPTTSPSTTPAVPEFQTITTITITLVAVLALAVAYKKQTKKPMLGFYFR